MRDIDVGKSTRIQLGYISLSPEIKVEIQSNPNKCTLTIPGLQERVFEHSIEELEAHELLLVHGRFQLRIIRHATTCHRFTINEILDNRQSRTLVLAEIETQDPDEKINFPDWIGKEVTQQAEVYSMKWLAQYGIQHYQLYQETNPAP